MGFIDSFRIADQFNHLIQIVQRDQQSFKNMCTFFRFTQLKGGATHDHFQPENDKLINQLAETQGPGTAVDKCNIVDPK